MFKSLTLFAALFLAGFAANCQTIATKTPDGNYQQIEIKPTIETLTAKATKTEATFTDKDGAKFPVWLSASGKSFIVKTSAKTGNAYRVYFKIQ